ncbi:MAG TPA: pentapeptide repeat-containing protein, partial [Ktedonobacteraceae bacterium]|nr:pentapeptide repeat-containing protein [Ktedonobacteraceae bacterium]
MSEKSRPTGSTAPGDRPDLKADCEKCFGLCCVVPAFAISADFAINKKAGQACPRLQSDYRCSIHPKLRQQGFRGCTVYDCFGAGQKVSQVLFKGQSWRQNPHTAKQMFEVFPIVRDLHELLWYLSEALTLQAAHPLQPDLSLALQKTEDLTNHGPATLLELDMASHHQEVNDLLLRVSELVRADVRSEKKNYRGADL